MNNKREMTTMKIPTTLKHKPVIVAEDYENVDGRNAYDSDAKGLSLGLAQWNERGKLDISAKVWRHTGEKWSRQSEELPMHRVLDLAILVCRGGSSYLCPIFGNDSQGRKGNCYEKSQGLPGK
jgi:hypothetical protein